MLLLLFRRVISTNYHPIREVVCTQFIYYRAESFSVVLLLNEPPTLGSENADDAPKNLLIIRFD